MLVLTRVPGQSVVLDGSATAGGPLVIVVSVLPSRPGIVKLGIDAPEGVGVRRAELELDLQAARETDVRGAPSPVSGE